MTQEEQIAALTAQVAALTAVINGMTKPGSAKAKTMPQDDKVHVVDYYKPLKKTNSRGKRILTGEFAKESKCILIYGNTKPIKDKIVETFGDRAGFGSYFVKDEAGRPAQVKGWLIKNTDKAYKTAEVSKRFASK